MPYHLSPRRVQQRLLASLTPTESGCLVSSYSIGNHGYVQIGWKENGQTIVTTGHRVAWEAAHGPIPDGLTVDHGGVCSFRPCCNVEHLRLLPNEVNAADNGWRKITEDQCAELRARFAAGGVLQRELAAEYGIDASTVSRIVNRHTWKSVA